MELFAKGGIGAKEESYTYSGEDFSNPRILVMGCGTAGSDMVKRLEKMGASGAEILAIDADLRRMERIGAEREILIGREGEGTGGDPAIRRAAAGRSLEEALGGADLVFVVAGLGEGTATGAASAICEMAKNHGEATLAIFTLPPGAETPQKGRRRPKLGEIGGLAAAANTAILLETERVMEMAPELSIDQAFSVIDQVVAEIVKGIVETVLETSLVNLDYAGLKDIVTRGGLASTLVGESGSEDGPEEAVRSALRSPMMEGDLRRAKGCILTITGGRDLSHQKASAIASALRRELAPGAEVVWGARLKEGREGKVGLLATMIGVEVPPDIPEAGTGRDEMGGEAGRTPNAPTPI